MIRAVISDFGGVLTTPLGNAFAAWSQESGVPLEELGAAMAAATERHGAHPLFLMERGELSEAAFLERLQAELDGHSLDGMFDSWWSHLERNPEMIETMAGLKDRGLRMAMLTNNVQEWEPRWRPMLPELDDIFEFVVDSGFVGMRKPEPEIYTLTVDRFGGDIAAAECLFVDDMEPNCEAARALGMTAVQFDDTEQAKRDIEAALDGD